MAWTQTHYAYCMIYILQIRNVLEYKFQGYTYKAGHNITLHSGKLLPYFKYQNSPKKLSWTNTLAYFCDEEKV